ncbi:HEAT repeat domain-containing protein [Vibrio splendidus]|uniref:HEAT repeat domain-containing protein n=1 Tax=Vibrio splendidus TaxID=29497 RepID=UPI000E090920|nr:HEAT repeat domain-containing protein [Vibrio splendidus]
MMKKSLATAVALLVSTSAMISTSAMAANSVQQTVDAPAQNINQVLEMTDTQTRIQQLSYMAQDQNQSVENRTGALQELASYPSQNALVAVARGLKDQNPEVREASVIGSAPYQLEHRWALVFPLLKDSDSMVRHTATSNLVRDYNTLDDEQKAQIEQPVAELITFLETQESEKFQLLFADVLRWHNEWEKAETIYVELVQSHGNNAQVWLSYADNFRAQTKDQEAVAVLDRGIEQVPNNAALHYSKSLTLVRLEEKKQAAQEIEVAANLAKDNSYYWYLNGVLQEELDIDKSTKSFEKAYLISGSPEQLYAVCDIYVRYGNEKTDDCLGELGKVAPDYVIEQLKEKRVAPSS